MLQPIPTKYLLGILEQTKNQSPANKRKVGAVIFTSRRNDLPIIWSKGYNYNPDCITHQLTCENKNGETYDTVIHAEQEAIFDLVRLNIDAANRENLSMLVSYSPCIECSKQIILFGIKNLYIVEEHPYNFRTFQYNVGSLSPLEFLLTAGVNVFLYDKETKTFKQEAPKLNKLCIYHSKDLDGFMSRLMFETCFDVKIDMLSNKKEYNYVGYNYELDAEWLNATGYKEYVFVDVTPPIEWLKNARNKNITIYDHHQNAINEILKITQEKKQINFLNGSTQVYYVEFLIQDTNTNVEIYFSKNNTLSACGVLFNAASFHLPIPVPFKYYVDIISAYDTWNFVNFDEARKEIVVSTIEALKVLNYKEFKEALKNDSEHLRKSLIKHGDYIRLKETNIIEKLLENNALIVEHKDKESNILYIACEKYPTYELEKLIREKFQNYSQVIYIGYSVDFKNTLMTFSVRNYVFGNKSKLATDALTIAKHFGGGGHPDAAGFSTSIIDGVNLFSTNMKRITCLLNYDKPSKTKTKLHKNK